MCQESRTVLYVFKGRVTLILTSVNFEDFVDQYGRAVDARRATVLLGAGASIGAGYPSWNKLLEPLRNELGVPDTFVDLTQIAQYLENTTHGRERLVANICSAIGSIPPEPTEIHRLIAQIPLDEIWTTNYDQLIESSSPEAVVIDQESAFTDALANSRRVYKMHGSIRYGDTSPVGGTANLVISSNDFDLYDISHPRFSRLLQAQILTRSFLFIGFSFTDPNFDAALRLVRLTAADRLMDHFAIIKRRPDDGDLFDHQAADLMRSGVHVVEVAEYDDMTALLRRVVARTRPIRLLISGSSSMSGSSEQAVDSGDRYPAVEEIPADLASIATSLGEKLGQAGISVTTAGLLGATAGYALIRSLGEDYDATRMMLVRRHNDAEIDRPNIRQGSITFVGEDPKSLRDSVFDQVRAVVVLGGGSGTLDEVKRARLRDMGIVPLARSGGVAHQLWEEMRIDLGQYFLGGRPIDPLTFEFLNSRDSTVAIDATVALAAQAMFLSPNDHHPPFK
jgi:hypothetical protein